LDNFNWQKDDIGQVMMWIHQDRGNFPYEKALRWIKANENKIQDWLN
ncbi:MAG: glycine/betaine ABC transporter substrate-binding protein, partial [Kosmotoga sp.]